MSKILKNWIRAEYSLKPVGELELRKCKVERRRSLRVKPKRHRGQLAFSARRTRVLLQHYLGHWRRQKKLDLLELEARHYLSARKLGKLKT